MVNKYVIINAKIQKIQSLGNITEREYLMNIQKHSQKATLSHICRTFLPISGCLFKRRCWYYYIHPPPLCRKTHCKTALLYGEKNTTFLHCFCIFHLYPKPYAQCLYTHLTQRKTPKIVQRKTSPTALKEFEKIHQCHYLARHF